MTTHASASTVRTRPSRARNQEVVPLTVQVLRRDPELRALDDSARVLAGLLAGRTNLNPGLTLRERVRAMVALQRCRDALIAAQRGRRGVLVEQCTACGCLTATRQGEEES